MPPTLPKLATTLVSFWLDQTEYRCSLFDGRVVYVEIINAEGTRTGVDPDFFDPEFLVRGLAVARPTDLRLGSDRDIR